MLTKLDKAEHREIMYAILVDIYRDFDLGTSLVFKGGTASYFIYSLDRFSTDLDFDLIGTIKEDIILDKIKKIISKYGVARDFYNKQNTIFLMLSYGEIDHNIKIEISKRENKSKYERVNFGGMDILVQTKSSIFTNKLFALLNRSSTANRDIYDIYFFFKNLWDIDEELLFILTKQSKKEYFTKVLDFLKKLGKNYNILFGLGELLDNKQKSFVKDKLILELIGIFEFNLKFKD